MLAARKNSYGVQSARCCWPPSKCTAIISLVNSPRSGRALAVDCRAWGANESAGASATASAAQEKSLLMSVRLLNRNECGPGQYRTRGARGKVFYEGARSCGTRRSRAASETTDARSGFEGRGPSFIVGSRRRALFQSRRSEERRVGKECRSRWSPY